MFNTTEKLIERITRAVAVAGGAGLLVAIAITCASIVGKLCRRLLNATLGSDFDIPMLTSIGPILGEEEIVQYAVGFALFTALPWLTLQRGHIAVDLLKPYFSSTMNRGLDVIGQLFFTAIVYLIMTQQWYLIFRKTRGGQESISQLFFSGDWTTLGERLRLHDESQILGIKLLPIYTVAELCVILLFIVSVFCLWRSGREFMQTKANATQPRHV